MKGKTIKRIFSYDIIRIIAALMVVMIHVTSHYVTNESLSSSEFFIANIFSAIARCAIPLFLMLSGALLLDEKKDFDIKKAISSSKTMFIILYIWSFIYTILFDVIWPLINNETIYLKEIINSFIFGHYHEWYLFMLIGLYLITPILKKIVNKENKELVKWFIVLSIIFRFVPVFLNFIINTHLGGNSLLSTYFEGFKLSFLNSYVTYYLLGWYLTNIDLKKKNRLIIYILGIIGLLITIIGPILYSDIDRSYSLFYSDGSIHILLYSIGLFVLIYYLFKNKNSLKYEKTLFTLSKLTFGVYLIHLLVLEFPRKLININSIFLEIIIHFTITGLVSFLAVYIISKIPLIKKIVRS